ncbi:hypothetical protein [Pimelobacter sp. 30-1]|uniref:hypothetical protein n=1 Tax=Pimelobacter sp. 30-1 TaxID=2004991 RepID=UPI001C05130B|nr:hypothetical protein [Pimelobacter sp. 30-1]MBU2697825.1 hypothetical protein [Pimelobacter sp. 30-1]
MEALDLIASMKPTEELVAAAADADVTAPLPDGTSLLLAALTNTDLGARYASAQWLLDRGCPLGAPNAEGLTELHVLLGQVKHDIPAARAIAEQLIAIGADVNAVSPVSGLVFCDVLWMKHTDEDLEPLYALWFDQPGVLDLETPADNGRTPLGIARALPYRASILERMERYLAETT